MRAIWSGSITFGLVNVPVKLYSAVEDHDVALHQVHDADGGRIHYERRCEVCGNIIDYKHIDKAYVEGDTTVVLTKEELAALPQERNREIEVVEFVPSDQVDPIMFEKSYYLAPLKGSVKAYALLRETLKRTERTAIVSFALRQKTRLAALRVRDEVLLVQTMLWADEVRTPSFSTLTEQPKVTKRELELSGTLVEQYSDEFRPEEFHDEYQRELRELIDKKLKHGDAIITEESHSEQPGEGGEVIDLMEALKASVERSRKKRSG